MTSSNPVRRARYGRDREKILAKQRQRYRDDPERHRRYNYAVEPSRPRPEHCEACGRGPGHQRVLSLDHDHSTGAFRGWLCQKCNASLGFLNDSEAFILRLRDYLIRSRS